MVNKVGLNVDFYYYVMFSMVDVVKFEVINMVGFLVKNNVLIKVFLFVDMEDLFLYLVNVMVNLNVFWLMLDFFGYKNYGVYMFNLYLYWDVVVKIVG